MGGESGTPGGRNSGCRSMAVGAAAVQRWAGVWRSLDARSRQLGSQGRYMRAGVTWSHCKSLGAPAPGRTSPASNLLLAWCPARLPDLLCLFLLLISGDSSQAGMGHQGSAQHISPQGPPRPPPRSSAAHFPVQRRLNSSQHLPVSREFPLSTSPPAASPESQQHFRCCCLIALPAGDNT